jgi:hypothetical protein
MRRQPPMGPTMRLQFAALGINPLDLSEADIGFGEPIAHEFAVLRHRLVDRADIAAAQQHDRLAHICSPLISVACPAYASASVR